MNNFNETSDMKIISICYCIDIIEHDIKYDIPCSPFSFVEYDQPLDALVAQQFLEDNKFLLNVGAANIRLGCGRFHLRKLS